MKNITKFTFSVCLLLSSFANAANFNSCGGALHWGGDNVTLYFSPISYPDGGFWKNRSESIMNIWNNIEGSNFKFNSAIDSGGVGYDNGKSEVWFGDTGGLLGKTVWEWSNYCFLGNDQHYDEVDVVMNPDPMPLDSNKHWSFTPVSTAIITEYNYDVVFLHELGHALGLKHYNDKIATMNSKYPNSGSVGHSNTVTPHSDDRHGLRYLYPGNTTARDFAVIRFKNSGSSTNNNEVLYNGSNTRTLLKGNTYQIEYTVENLGTSTETPQVNFYISTNTHISTSDTYIGGVTFNQFPEGASYHGKANITIPTNLANGSSYSIGYKVDPYNGIQESDESNNFVSLVGVFKVFQ